MDNRYAPHPISLSYVCEHLGVLKLDQAGAVIGYTKNHYCLGHLEYLLSLLQRKDRRTRVVLIKLCRFRIASSHLIPIIWAHPHDRSLVAAAVTLLSLLTKPVEKPFPDHKEYLSNVVANLPPALPVIFRHLDDTLDLVQGKWEIGDDWNFVQSVILLIRNMLCNEDYCMLHNIPKDDGQLFGLSDRFLEKIFVKNLMDEMLLVTQHIDKLNNGDSVEVLEIRDSTFYKVIKISMAFKTSKGNSVRILPFRKETMQLMLVPCCTAASVAISGFCVLAAKIVETSTSETQYSIVGARRALAACPYLYVPFGILGIALSAGATTEDGLLGFTSGLVLAQFLYFICVVGLIAFLKTALGGFLVAYYTCVSILACMGLWGVVCEYPKWLNYCVHWTYVKVTSLIFGCVRRPRAAPERAVADGRRAARRCTAGGVAQGGSDLEAGIWSDAGKDNMTAVTGEFSLTSGHKVL